MKKVSDIVSDFFEEQNIKHVFLLSGGMMMHLLDSVSRARSLTYICNHHEQACSMAAEAYARISNGVGLCYATSGPGSTNIVTGVAGAWLDSVPVVFITGQSRTSLTIRGYGIPDLRMAGNFEVNIVDIVKPITKYAVFVDKAQDILYELQKAFYTAKEGRPGPVLLDIPLDIQGAMINEQDLRTYEPSPSTEKNTDESGLALAVEKLKSAKRPLIIGGHGIRVAGKVELFRKLVSEWEIPVVTTQLANDLIPYDDDLYIGKFGLRGDRAGNFAVQTADVILCLGTSLHITNTGYEIEEFAPNAYKIVVDIDHAFLKKNKVVSNLQINEDVSVILAQLQDLIAGSDIKIAENWKNRLYNLKEKYAVIKEQHVVLGNQINTYSIVDTLSRLLKGDEIIISDAGSLYYIVGQTFRTKADQRVIISGALGAMGYALPASIGACYAAPGKQVICITGDGSMQTNVQELQTISHYKLNCKIIVINNKGYASIRNSQSSFLDGHIAASSEATGVTFPEWEIVAKSYGIPFRREVSADNLANFIEAALQETGPLFLEIVIPENVIMMPSVTSKRLDNGSFKSNMLHEMTPIITDDPLLDMKMFS
jgi:acetolactate synthase-1/2/3 large subunit